jgi:serine/threonine protein kinase
VDVETDAKRRPSLRLPRYKHSSERAALTCSTLGNALSKEIGVEMKLAFIAPEQTGRMPAEPDSRTDIYSLGILFYSMLCGDTPFDGSSPLDVMQNVLNKRIPPVSSKRMDIPEALSSVIQRMTQKNIEDRYHSTSGLKGDLTRIRELLSEGDGEGLKNCTYLCRKSSIPSQSAWRKRDNGDSLDHCSIPLTVHVISSPSRFKRCQLLFQSALTPNRA